MKKIFADKDRRFIILLLFSIFSFYLSWALIIPFNKAPDEALRFDIVKFIFNYRQLPVAGDPRLHYGVGGVTYAAMPLLSYILSDFAGVIAQALKLPVPLYLASRMISVISGVITVYFVWLTAKKLYPTSFTRYFVPIFIAFEPQFSFINSYTNQDSFMVMLSSIIIYLWVRGLETNWDYRTVVFIGIAMGLTLLSYLNGYALVLATLLIVLISYRGKNSKEFFLKFLLCAGIVMVISGWFFVRNISLYHGDVFGLHVTDQIAQCVAFDGYKPSQLTKVRNLSTLFFNTNWLMKSMISFWACFEHMSVWLKPIYYFYIFLLCLISFAGLSYRYLEKAKCGLRTLTENKLVIAFVFTAIVAFLLSVHYSSHNDYQPQGRYLFPALIPIIFMLTIGFEHAFSPKHRIVFYKMTGVIFILIDLYSIYALLFQRYFI